LSKLDTLPVRSAKAPPRTYFGSSVLPSSITSGTCVPASVVSTLAKWFGHCWYWMLTCAPVSAVNLAFASATACGQPVCASTMSQTVRVLPLPSNGLAALGVLAGLLLLLPHAAAPINVAASAAATAIRRFTRSSSMSPYTRWTSAVRGGFWGAAPTFGAMVELSFMKES